MIQEKTGIKTQRGKSTQDTACKMCGSACTHTDLQFNSCSIVKCAQCGVMQVHPFPSKKEILSLYADENFAREDGTRFKGIAEMVSIFFRKKRAKLIQKLVPRQNAKILDVGAGRGIMLQELKKSGRDVYGVQPASQTKDTRANIFYGSLADENFPDGFFDCVTLYHVLEHLAAPKETLHEIFRILKPDGILVIELPNADGLVPRLFKTCWFGYNVPEHLYHFTPQSLKQLLSKAGFMMTKESFFSLEYSPFVLLQTLFNNLFHDDDNFFRSMREKKEKHAVPLSLKITYGVLAACFSFPCLILSYLLGILKQGDVMTFYCKKQ